MIQWIAECVFKYIVLGGVILSTLKTVVTVVYILVCIALTVLVLLQQGKANGLGAVAGTADTYWGKNKGRSAEGKKILFTRILAVLFFVLSFLLCMDIWK